MPAHSFEMKKLFLRGGPVIPYQTQASEPESEFLIQDPFGLRKAITPFFAFDLSDGMLANPVNSAAEGLGTSFYITPWGRQLSAMHLTTDFILCQRPLSAIMRVEEWPRRAP
jgi:hypothetical protein